MDAFISYRFLVNKAAQDLYFIGIKKP
jgi:hypothetical protein